MEFLNEFMMPVVSGLITGAASTGMHQLFSQFIEKK